jgi:hypothetical protein
VQQFEESAKKVTKDRLKYIVELELVFYWGGGGGGGGGAGLFKCVENGACCKRQRRGGGRARRAKIYDIDPISGFRS